LKGSVVCAKKRAAEKHHILPVKCKGIYKHLFSYFSLIMMRRVLCPRVSVSSITREFSIMDKAGGMFGNMGNM
jgi:hypothetical protein